MDSQVDWRFAVIDTVLDRYIPDNYYSVNYQIDQFYQSLENPDTRQSVFLSYWDDVPYSTFTQNFDVIATAVLTPTQQTTIKAVYKDKLPLLDAAKLCINRYQLVSGPSAYRAANWVNGGIRCLLKPGTLEPLLVGAELYNRWLAINKIPVGLRYKDPYQIRVEEAGLSTRAYHTLIRASGARSGNTHITIGEALAAIPSLRSVKQCGPAAYKEIMTNFKGLGIDVSKWESSKP